MLRQKDQINKTSNINDDFSPSGGFEGANILNLEDDLNAIRTQIKKILGGGSGSSPLQNENINWFTQPTSSLFSISLTNKNVWYRVVTNSGETSPSGSFDTLYFDEGSGISVSVSDKNIEISNNQNKFTSFSDGSSTIELQDTPKSQSIEFVGNKNIKTLFTDNGTPTININYTGNLFVERYLFYNIKSYPETNTITPSEEQDTLNFIGEGFMKPDTQYADILYLEHEYDFSINGKISVGDLSLTSLDEGEILYSNFENKISGDYENFRWDNSNNRISIRDNFTVNNGNIRIGQSGGQVDSNIDNVLSSYSGLSSPSCMYKYNNFIIVGHNSSSGVNISILSNKNKNTPRLISTYTTSRTSAGGIISLTFDGSFIYALYGSSFTLEIINAKNIENPYFVKYIELSSSSATIASCRISGRKLFISSDLGFLYSYNITSSENPIFIEELNIGRSINDFYIFENKAYLATSSVSSDIFVVVDLSDFGILGQYSDENSTTLENMFGVYSTGTYSYIIYKNSNRLEILNVLDPENPEPLDRIVSFGEISGDEVLNNPIKVKVYGTFAYVACAGNSSVSPSLTVIDLLNPQFPTFAKVINDSQSRFSGIADFEIDGKYAYVIGESSGVLSVVDISGIQSDTARIPEVFSSQVVSDNLKVHSNVLIENSLNVGQGGMWFSSESSKVSVDSNIYIGDSLGVGFSGSPNYDIEVRGGKVRQDPGNKASISSIGRDFIDRDILSDVIIHGDLAYVINFGFSSMDIYNIKNPDNIVYISGYFIGANLTDLPRSEDTNPKGYAYSYSYGYELSSELDYWEMLQAQTDHGLLRSIINGKYLYITAAKSGYFITIDISNPYDPIFISSTFVDEPEPAIGYGANGLYYANNRLYVVSGTVKGAASIGSLSIFDVSDPENPIRTGYYLANNSNELHGASDIIVEGDYCYVCATAGNKVSIYNISDENNISRVSMIYANGNQMNLPTSIALHGQYIFVGTEGGYDGTEDPENSSGSLVVADISDLNNPQIVTIIYNGDVYNLSGISDIKIIEKYLLVLCKYDSSLTILNINNPRDPEQVSRLRDSALTEFGANSFDFSNNSAYIVSYDTVKNDNFFFSIGLDGLEAFAGEFGEIKTSDLRVKNNFISNNNVDISGDLSAGSLYSEETIHAGEGFSGQIYAESSLIASYSETSVGANDELIWGRLQPNSNFYEFSLDEDQISFDIGKIRIDYPGVYRIVWYMYVSSDATQDIEFYAKSEAFEYTPVEMKAQITANEREDIRFEYIGYIEKYEEVDDYISFIAKIPTSGTTITWDNTSSVTVERL